MRIGRSHEQTPKSKNRRLLMQPRKRGALHAPLRKLSKMAVQSEQSLNRFQIRASLLSKCWWSVPGNHSTLLIIVCCVEVTFSNSIRDNTLLILFSHLRRFAFLSTVQRQRSVLPFALYIILAFTVSPLETRIASPGRWPPFPSDSYNGSI